MKAWLSKLFSESGDVSFGRVASGIALGVSIVWVSYIVFRRCTIPDLAGIAAFISALYAFSKAGETIQKMKGDK